MFNTDKIRWKEMGTEGETDKNINWALKILIRKQCLKQVWFIDHFTERNLSKLLL